jgi:hypothetical protein
VTDATACPAACPAGGIEDVLRGLVRSPEPAVVLSSLARHSQPSFSDACAIDLSEGTEALFHVSFPDPDPATAPELDGATPAGKTVTTAFALASGHGYASFAGVAVHTWTGREPADGDAIIARLLVAHALGIVREERLARATASAEERAAKLAVELITSRAEGEATGLLMARHGLTRQEAVSVLRQSGRVRPSARPRPSSARLRAVWSGSWSAGREPRQ